MTKFPNGKSVKVTKGEFQSLVLALNETIENHIKYVKDEVTETAWKDLECNGITKKDRITVPGVAHMLNMTDENQMTLAQVIDGIFKMIPILRNYWNIKKLNTQSLHIERIANVNMSRLFENLKNTVSTPVQKQKVQTTLTQIDKTFQATA